jgi:hypothetical protein
MNSPELADFDAIGQNMSVICRDVKRRAQSLA